MLFNSLEYLLFLPLVLLAYWLFPKQLKLPFLLIASYYFYMSWKASYGLLLLILTVFNFFLGLFIAKADRSKRLLLIAGISANLGCLGVFKYTNFILSSFSHFVAFLSSCLTSNFPLFSSDLHLTSYLHLARANSIANLPIVLPLGISFFIFEFIHYLTDIFKGSPPIKSFLRFSLFAAFFPSQIAGPIKRYQDFDKQLNSLPRFSSSQFQSGLWLIWLGMFKKIALGDNLAPLVQAGFDNPVLMGTLDAWACAIAFALQIYYDFSGYTDIGRGSARLLGFYLPENFNMPYIASSLREFWHRWHISLSTWLRDYLYIPLGGSQKQISKTLVNLVLTMLLGGLWHGASWTFVFWGGIHGLGLAVNRLWDQALMKQESILTKAARTKPGILMAHVITLVFLLLSWVMFRAPDISCAASIYQKMFWWHRAASPGGNAITELFLQSTLPAVLLIYSIICCSAISLAYLRKNNLVPQKLRFCFTPSATAHGIIFVGASLLILGLAPPRSIPFIYFQF